MNAPAGERHEWKRVARGWYLAYGVLAAITGALFFVDDTVSPAQRWGGLVVLVALCCWYAAIGTKLMHGGGHGRGLLYVSLALPLTVGLYAIVPFGAVMLCMLYPHIWSMLRLRQALAATVVGVIATALAMVRWTGFSVDVLVVAIAGMLVAPVLGFWIGRIIEQSKRRAELIAELAATRAELAELSRRAGAMAERERLAREIHDTLAQGFTSVLLLLEALETELGKDDRAALGHLHNARKTAQENLAEARAMVAASGPPHLRDASLPDALRQLVDRIGPELAVESRLVVTGEPRPLATSGEVVLLRATQEALANVRKHAKAKHVDVVLAYESAEVVLRIADDGCGFDPVRATGFGLVSMRERVAQVGGEMHVDAVAGTVVRVALPL
ncbi:sensor histidine kinase [Fodinicola feengrottensis]|uniref:sensor histidine kinase n=1 Tax=Fodinicola feengrottensis TaxID=435914 RepID=UPI0031D5CB17